jgi:hypothetical protein
MHTRILVSTRPRAAYLGLLALTSWAALSFPARALASVPVACGSQSTAVDVRAALTVVGDQVAITEKDFRDTTMASPASWRLHEDLERLERKYRLLRQLGDTVATRDGATPGSPAQWRAQESSDAVCEQLQLEG